VNTVMSLRVPWNAGNFLRGWTPTGFWRRTQLHGVTWLVISPILHLICIKHKQNFTITITGHHTQMITAVRALSHTYNSLQYDACIVIRFAAIHFSFKRI
jgi:hypothetical protein